MAGRRERKTDLQGKWLKEALAEQDVSVYRLAKELGYSRENSTGILVIKPTSAASRWPK
ncbi:hypothetical protein GO730_10650 [Spirosoma sp. HMF3257]|uniref:hypothetical protein n=1 Tax=Spirosoma telluris TaxID=2183553 RepID=UPI0012FB5457|nr:hypothetical protein [Spirosoma telluris]